MSSDRSTYRLCHVYRYPAGTRLHFRKGGDEPIVTVAMEDSALAEMLSSLQDSPPTPADDSEIDALVSALAALTDRVRALESERAADHVVVDKAQGADMAAAGADIDAMDRVKMDLRHITLSSAEGLKMGMRPGITLTPEQISTIDSIVAELRPAEIEYLSKAAERGDFAAVFSDLLDRFDNLESKQRRHVDYVDEMHAESTGALSALTDRVSTLESERAADKVIVGKDGEIASYINPFTLDDAGNLHVAPAAGIRVSAVEQAIADEAAERAESISAPNDAATVTVPAPADGLLARIEEVESAVRTLQASVDCMQTDTSIIRGVVEALEAMHRP